MKRSRGARIGLAAAGAAAALVVAVQSAADSPGEASRYPYDPVCAWGRVANGKGMLVRCITKDEAEALVSPHPPPAPAPGSSAPPPPPGTPQEPQQIEVRVGPVTVDEGALPKAEKKLGVPKDKYAGCVTGHGGLSGSEGEVAVRFLVRARGRAEGVSVEKRKGVSAAAARCIADVVDRRYVGVPEAPMVGATVIVRFSRQK